MAATISELKYLATPWSRRVAVSTAFAPSMSCEPPSSSIAHRLSLSLFSISETSVPPSTRRTTHTIPRKCAWTNRLITAKDHAAVQINIGHLNADGVYTGAFTTLALAGNVRAWGTADTAVDLLWKKAQAARAE